MGYSLNMQLTFINKSVLDKRAFTIMGMSAKCNDNPIGQFGTGLKYSIAGILRLGGLIEIQTSEGIYNFGTKPASLRDKNFNVVTCNGEELSYTTDHGKNWEPWQFYRELYSNMLDEQGSCYAGDDFCPVVNEIGTKITVVCPEVFEAYQNHNLYFSTERTPICEVEGLKIFQRISENSRIYNKGVCVDGHSIKKSSFDFEIIDNIDLTEDRGIKYISQTKYRIGLGISLLTNKKLITALFRENGKENIEFNRYYYNNNCKPSEEFLDVVEELYLTNPLFEFPNDTLAVFQKYRKLERKTLEFSDEERKMLNKCLRFWKTCGYADMADYEIVLVEHQGNELYGYACDGKIQLTRKSFEHGIHDLCATLLEEYGHLKTSFSDHTREFQNWIFAQAVNVGTKKSKILL